MANVKSKNVKKNDLLSRAKRLMIWNMKSHPTTYSRKIRVRLAERGWTQTDLARFIGVTAGAITHYLKGRNTGADIRSRICRALDLPESIFNEPSRSPSRPRPRVK